MSHGNSADLSISAARGATRSRARSRTRSRISRCSWLSGSLGTGRSLEKDLERDLRRAAVLEQPDGLMQVDPELARQNLGLEAAAAGAPELLPPPGDDLVLARPRPQKL